MKVKTVIALALLALLMVLSGGCNGNLLGVSESAENLKGEEITDPVELERLWQEYFYDSITTVGNTRTFNTAEEIDPLYVAEFCWFKYIEEHGKESLPLADEGSTLRLFPLETALEYAERYFNLTHLDITNIDEYAYNVQKQAFTFNLGTEEPHPSYKDSNAWGIHLDKVIQYNDGTITAVLVQYDSSQTRRIELTKTFTFKEREDGSLYFVTGRWEYVNNHLVTISGDYQRFDRIEGFDGSLKGITMLGETEGKLILAAPYEKGKNASLMLVNPAKMKVEKKYVVGTQFSVEDATLRGQSIFIRLSDKVVKLDRTLSQSQEILLPVTIREKIEREPQYNEMGMPDVFFGGYDVSNNGKTFVYADETGVKMLNAIDNSEKLLAATVPIMNSRLLNSSYHRNPRFVSDQRKVITTMTGYESTLGYTLCDLDSGTAKTFNITSESSSTGLIRYDTGLLEVNSYSYNQEKETAECKTDYLDFTTGDVQEITVSEPGDTGDIRMPDYTYVGQNYAAFITYNSDGQDNANNMYYLNRLNLKTMQLDARLLSVKAGETHILGVLADGRIVFWYSYNPSENGICITQI